MKLSSDRASLIISAMEKTMNHRPNLVEKYQFLFHRKLANVIGLAIERHQVGVHTAEGEFANDVTAPTRMQVETNYKDIALSFLKHFYDAL